MKSLTQLLTAASAGIFATNASAGQLTIGAELPAVAQKNQDGKVIQLTETGKNGYLLVYFYPKADTPGCTKQACSLRDSYAKLADQGVTILGVSTDSVKSQKAFKDKYKLPFDLLADADSSIVNGFGVPKTLGFSKRQAFLFKDGKLVWSDTSASTEKQAADVLKFLAAR
jgi:peroxiredoxin Q/BCP